MSIPTKKNPLPSKQPSKPGDAEIDVDDAQIQPPSDDAFEEKDPAGDDRLNRDFDGNLEPFHYRG